jgi:hypothetical protein
MHLKIFIFYIDVCHINCSNAHKNPTLVYIVQYTCRLLVLTILVDAPTLVKSTL